MFNRYALVSSSLLVSLTLLCGCHHPERISAEQANDNALDCAGIQDGIRYAEQAHAAAREHDRFEFRYMLVIPAFVSAYNFDRAEKAADARKATLEQLYTAKNCAYAPQQAKTPSFNGMPSSVMPGEENIPPGGAMPVPGAQGGIFPPPAPYGYPEEEMPGR